MPKIIVEGPTAGSHQPIQLHLNNSAKITEFPTNTEVTVTDDELTALRDTDHVIQIIDAGSTAEAEHEPAPAAGGDAGGGGGTGASAAEASLPENFLDRSVKDIVADLAGFDAVHLARAKAHEEAGKTRKSLIAAIDELLAARTPPAA